MASKVHVQDNSVSERRLRPIYEWLDAGNNKKALQECDKVLKKTPNLHCAKALRALSFLRMGKETDCTSILDALVSESPADDASLQAISLCYRELQQLDKICKLYEAALKTDPTNEEFHTHLFMAYVRMANFQAQQQSAMNLYKLKPKNPYYCWAVMSVIQQATRGVGATDPQKRTVLLSLAERMFNKFIEENKVEAEQEVQLYLMILDLQGKYEEALRTLSGPLGARLICGSMVHHKLPYLIKSKEWEIVNIKCKDILLNSIDRWDIWKIYIQSLFELMQERTHLNNHIEDNNGDYDSWQKADRTPEDGHEFICRVVEIGSDNGYLLRGPYLARFELCKHLTKQGIDSNDLLGETVELFIEYFRKFGHKQCCVSDLRCYVPLLSAEKQADLAARLIKDVGISATSVPQSEQQMQRHICSLQLSRLCGSHHKLSSDHLAALVTAFSLHYQHGYQTYGLNMLPTDQGPSDPYAILAVHILYDLAYLTKSSQPLITALVLLESLLKNSPSNFNAKLLAIRIYHTLGAGLGAHEMYESLDVKHLQMDSLGYIHCARLSTTGLYALASHLFDSTLKFFSSSDKDSSDHLTFSYKFGSFIKLDEFMDFREKLNNSLHYTTTAVDRIILNLIECTSTQNLYHVNTCPKDSHIDFKALRNNHDLSVYLCWDPEWCFGSPEESEEAKDLFHQSVGVLKLRTHIVWVVSAAIELVKAKESSKSKCVEILTEKLTKWETDYLAYADKTYSIKEVPVIFPLPSRLHSHLKLPYYTLLSQLFKLLVTIARDKVEEAVSISKCVNEDVGKLIKNVCQLIADESAVEDCYWGRRSLMETVTNTVEIISISAIACVLCYELVKPPQGKKSKKKSDQPQMPAKELISDICKCLHEEINKFDATLESWNSSSVCDLSDRLALLNLCADGQNAVFEHINYSHSYAVKDIRAALKNKLKLLGNLVS